MLDPGFQGHPDSRTEPSRDAGPQLEEGGDRQGVWIVVPAYNERPRIGQVLTSLTKEYGNVVVVDDASTDGTDEIVRQFPVWLVQHPVNLGQGAAIETGRRFALAKQAQFIVTFDSDGQHQMSDVCGLLAPLLKGDAAYSLGSRFLGCAVDIPLFRRVLLHAARLFTFLISGVRLSDAHNGLRAMTREGASKIQGDCTLTHCPSRTCCR